MPINNRRPAWWVPTLYFAEGLPNVVVTGVAGVAMLRCGFTPAATAAYTSALFLPWVIKPLWAPLVERLWTRRGWIVAMQVAMALCFAPLAIFLPEKSWLPLTLVLLAGAGLASATHDVAADGFYMLALDQHRQAEWAGGRNTFYRLAVTAGNGGLVWLAGSLEIKMGVPRAWAVVFVVTAGVLAALAAYHRFAIPRVEEVSATPRESWGVWAKDFRQTLLTLARRPGFGRILAFMLLYRFAEGQVLKGNNPFFLAPRGAGGLGLATEEVGQLYGTLGTVALLVGGIAAGLVIARTGLRRQLWLMAAAMNLPNLLYIWMAWAQPQSRWLIGSAIGIEQFGYGMGSTAYMVYLLYVAQGGHSTSLYAICSGITMLSLSLAGFMAAEALRLAAPLAGGGYVEFFSWVMVCTLAGFAVLWKLPLEGDFGRARRGD
jgi:MFS transporter, PAT family, beta-lactamase induction signal transducer AmpG